MFVRTVLGDIAPDRLGVCYAHEHIIIDPGFVTLQNPDFLLDDADKAAAELTAFKATGGGGMVDSMPCDCGRNVLKLAGVSRRSGVHVVCPTGIHLSKYYPPGHWSWRLSEDELADLFVTEIEQGIDANDCGGPVVRRTEHRAGVIKVAGGRDRLSDHEKRAFGAASQAHRRTGCPILTHTEQGTAGLEQAALLIEAGVDPGHIVLSHCDRLPEVGYHRDLLQTGVRLEYDSAFRWPKERGNPTLDLLIALLGEFPDQIMLGMDAARRGYWKSYGGGPGLTYLLDTFLLMMKRAGIGDHLIHRIFVTTPAQTYTFAKPQAAVGN